LTIRPVRALLICAGLALVGADLGVAQEGQVAVDVRGLRPDMRTNVMATLSLTRSGDRVRLAEGRVRALLDRAPREVRAALEPFGYYEPTVRDSLRYDGRRWRVTLDVNAGPPVILVAADVRVTGPGSDDPALAEVLRATPLSSGAPLSHVAYEAVKTALATAAADRGYLDASFDSAAIRVDRTARTARATVFFATGPRYAMGPVTFRQSVLDEGLLRSLVPWAPGDPFDGSRLLALQATLLDGPYYSAVEIVPRRDLAAGGVVPIDVVLTPANPERYSLGAGYGSDTGPRGTANVEFRRLNQAGHRAEIDAWVAQVERRFSARYYLPFRSRHASLLSFSGGFVDENPKTSDTETWLVGTNLAGLWGSWRSEIGITLQRAAFEVGAQSGVTTLALLGLGLSRVRADDRLDPRRGILTRLRARGASDALIGEVTLLDVGAEARGVVSPTPELRLRARAEAAALFTPDFDELPGSMRYFAGGDRSVRGYGYRELGPRDAAGEPLGGSRLLVGSLEVEWRFVERWGVAAFLDAGNALSSFSSALEAGTGAGVRWRSPVGMIRLDGAWAVTEPGTPFRLHLNVGPEL